MGAHRQITVERVDSLEALQALEGAWRHLECQTQTQFPFLTHAWAVAWWRHLAKRTLRARDALCIRVLRAPDQEVVAIASLMCTERPSFGPLRSRQLQFLGRDDGDITEMSGILCVPALEAEAHQVVLEDLQRDSRAWDWMLWRRLRADSPGHRQVRAFGVTQESAEAPNYVLRLAAGWEPFRASLPRNIKESLRKCYNSLKRDGLTLRLCVIEDPRDIRAALGHFFRLHSARAAVLGGRQHRDVFDTEPKRSFLVDVCARLAQQGCTRVFLLEVGGRVVAVRIGFAMGDCLYLYYSGYEPSFGKYSVMTTTVAETLKYAIAEGFRSVNLSNGNDVSKTRWAPQEELYRAVVQLSPKRRGRLAFHAYRQSRRLLHALRRASRATPPVPVPALIDERRAPIPVALQRSAALGARCDAR